MPSHDFLTSIHHRVIDKYPKNMMKAWKTTILFFFKRKSAYGLPLWHHAIHSCKQWILCHHRWNSVPTTRILNGKSNLRFCSSSSHLTSRHLGENLATSFISMWVPGKKPWTMNSKKNTIFILKNRCLHVQIIWV